MAQSALVPEPFKNFFSEQVICDMGAEFAQAWPGFARDEFVATAASNLDQLELKARSTQISDALAIYLPDDFEQAAGIMLASLAPANADTLTGGGISGWAVMPMTHYVGLHGLGHFDISMTLFREMTKRFTSEFGIRYFLLEEPARTLKVLQRWTCDSDHHVRRLVSEGTRPRLPWAMRLPVFIEDPAPILPLLESLRDDKEEYVRRSVANNLNDIAKDHPDLVAQIAGRWLQDADRNRQKLVRHGCRTLIKQGHRGTLDVLGYSPPSIQVEQLDIRTPQVQFGDALDFELALVSTSRRPQKLIIDYAIHHRKANGSMTPKVFKWKATTLAPLQTLSARRKHAIRKITTRVYYPGTHRLEIFVNGESVGSLSFDLLM